MGPKCFKKFDDNIMEVTIFVEITWNFFLQKRCAGIFDNLIFYTIFSNFGRPRWVKNQNQENCSTMNQKKSIKSNITKKQGFSTNIETPIFFSQNPSLKIPTFQSVWKFLYILPYVTQEKHIKFSVERNIQLCKK